MTETELDQQLVASANDFLQLFSPDKPPRYAGAGERARNPVGLLRQSLEEAQNVLTVATNATIESRSTALARQRRTQKIINGLHFVTASSFGLLVAGQWPEVMKWIVPGVSLSAGLLGIAMPGYSEGQLFNDIAEVSELKGRIVAIKTQMLVNGDKLPKPAQAEAFDILKQCTALATRHQLDQIAAAHGYLPRPEPKAETQ